jgi:SAM-dependent methyltransferase
MSSATEAERAARVSQHWEAQFAKNRADPSLWTNNHIVARHINQLITDAEHHWLPWFLNCYVSPHLVFENSLSICCGDAAHELALAKTGRVKFISGFDISEGAVAQARAAFRDAAIDPAAYRFEVADANELSVGASADLIFSTGALHHVADLEALLSRLADVLTRDGYFIVVEYVGPNRFQWREAQVNVVNAIVEQLDLRYLRGGVRTTLGPPALDDIIAIDPSEAVRSEEIVPLLRDHFAIEYLREFNGTIVHPFYPLLNPAFTNAGSPDFDSIVRLILVLEDQLIKAKVLSSDFVFAICRSKHLQRTTGVSDETRRLSSAFIGYIDRFDETGIYGWAANRASQSAIRVDIYLNDALHATVRADGFREDLLQAGEGDGRHGFGVLLDAPPPAQTIARLTISGTNHVLATRAFADA